MKRACNDGPHGPFGLTDAIQSRNHVSKRIFKRSMGENTEQLDLLIIGAGPAGLSAADTAARAGLNYLVIERGLIADTIFRYPVGRTVFSTPNELEMREGALVPCREKPTREELLSHYVRFTLEAGLRINTEEEAQSIERNEADGFV